MRLMPLIALVGIPLVFWPSVWAVLAAFAIALPVGILLAGPEKPTELDPAIWDKDPAVRRGRLAAAMERWRLSRD